MIIKQSQDLEGSYSSLGLGNVQKMLNFGIIESIFLHKFDCTKLNKQNNILSETLNFERMPLYWEKPFVAQMHKHQDGQHYL